MLTKLRIRNFKQFDDVEIELGQNVVFIGANNSGKTSALQALALWYIGHTKLGLRRLENTLDGQNTVSEVALNRLDLTGITLPDARLLWRDLRTQNGQPNSIVISVDVLDNTIVKSQELSFDFVNEESIICRLANNLDETWFDLTLQAVVLPSLGGLTETEEILQRNSIRRLLGQGQSAQVLRNLCYWLYTENLPLWDELVRQIQVQFGIELISPEELNGQIRMSYRTRKGIKLDLSSAGRGMLQVLLLLAYMYVNPGAVLLLDEPDAHLEIIRQREIYSLLTSVAREQGSQIIAATHSEIIMEEAAKKDVVIAFVGKPHRANDRRSQVEKALKSIPFDHYYQAERVGWVLYIEGSTDISILKGLARKLNHETANLLDEVFVQPVNTNAPQLVRDHFYGLQEAKPDLVGYALFDRLEKQLGTDQALTIQMWRQREIENYLCTPETLITFAREYRAGNVFSSEHVDQREVFMRESINEIEIALRTLRRPPAWSADIKATDDFLDPLFDTYFSKLKLPNLLLKTNYHVLTEFVPVNLIDPEVTEKLDAIAAVAKRAKPRED